MKFFKCVKCEESFTSETGVVFKKGMFYNLYYNWRKGYILEGLEVDAVGEDNEWFSKHFRLV